MNTKSFSSNQAVLAFAGILSLIATTAIVTQYQGRIDAGCSLSGCHFQIDGRHVRPGEPPSFDRKDL